MLLISGLGGNNVYAQTGSPSNDNFVSARVVFGASGTLTGTNVGATVESGEPDHLSAVHEHSVWYQWTAPSNCTVLFTTLGSNFDTVLAVYTGNAVNSLTLIGSNDDYDSQSSGVSFGAVSGTTYRIAVDSYRTQVGDITLNWQLTAFSNPPGVPSAPSFTAISQNGLTVTAPALSTNSTSLTLQQKRVGEADSAYVSIQTGIAGGATRAVSGLTSGTSYTFRFGAVGNATTWGSGANVTTLTSIGRTIYVSPSGNTRRTGTLADPISDLTYVFEVVARENDNIVFRGGTYITTKSVLVDKPGLKLSNYQSENPIIKPSVAANSSVGYVLSIRNSRVEVSGLEIRGGESYGIKIETEDPYGAQIPTRGVVVRNCRVGDTGADCFKVTSADNLLIENCNIGPSGLIHPDAEGIDVIGSHGATVRNCFVHDTKTTGIYFKGGTTDGLIEGCTVTNAGNQGILLGQDTDPQSMRNPLLPTDPNYDPLYNDANLEHSANDPEARRCIARNNTISNTQAAGIGTFSGEDILFENNRVINPSLRDEGSGFYVHINRFSRGARNVTFINNTIEISGARPFVILNKLQMNTFTARNNHYRYTGSPNNFLVWPGWPNWTGQPDVGSYVNFDQWHLNYDPGSTYEKVQPTTTAMFRLHKQPATQLAMNKR